MCGIKHIVGILLVALAAESAQGTVANYLADRAMSRMLSWANRGGAEWLTMPGGMGQGLNSTKDGYYTLAFAGARFQRIDKISRKGDAYMGADVKEFPLYIDKQNLTFQLAMENLTVLYERIVYTNYEGLMNASASVTSDAIRVNLTITITGENSKCVASGAGAEVSYGGRNEITNRSYAWQYYPEIDEALSSNFEANIRQGAEVFIYAAIDNMFDGYDICQDRSMDRGAFLKLKSLKVNEMSLKKPLT